MNNDQNECKSFPYNLPDVKLHVCDDVVPKEVVDKLFRDPSYTPEELGRPLRWKETNATYVQGMRSGKTYRSIVMRAMKCDELLKQATKLAFQVERLKAENEKLKDQVSRLASMQMNIKEAKDDRLLLVRYYFEYGDWLSNTDVKEIASILLDGLVETDKRRRTKEGG